VRLRLGWLAVTTVAYSTLAELQHRANPRIPDAGGHCEQYAGFARAALLLGLAIYLVSTALFARRQAGKWAAATALHAGLAVLTGAILGSGLFRWIRSFLASEHGGMCFSIGEPWVVPWYAEIAEYVIPVLIAALLAPLVGYVARTVRTIIHAAPPAS
jgi:hypothetical protein